jgi:dolichyl-phosphate-mannose--protein O-mannosyl transferase
MLRPVYLSVENLGKGLNAHIYLLGNPFLWYTGLLFLLMGIVQVVRKETPALLFTVLSVFAYWLPWALSPRKVVFLYHFLPSLIFLLLTSVYFLNELWNSSRKGRIIVVLYICIAGGVFLYFYPIIAGWPIKDTEIDRFMWLHTWR